MSTPTSAAASGRRLAAVTAVLLTAGLAGALGLDHGPTPTAATFTSRSSAQTTVTTAAACASGTPYATYVAAMAASPTLWWRFAEGALTSTVADSSGNSLAGNVIGTGVAFGTVSSGIPQCDTTLAALLPADDTGTDFVVLPASRTAPATMTIAFWVRAAAGATGDLVSLTDANVGLPSVVERAVGIDAAGNATFTVRTASGPGVVLRSGMPVTDSAAHLLVSTLSGGHAVLYVDGVQVDQVAGLPLPPAPAPEYWRTGGTTQAGAWLDEVAIWEGTALSGSQVGALAGSDHW